MHPLAGHPNTSLDESVTWCTDNLLSFSTHNINISVLPSIGVYAIQDIDVVPTFVVECQDFGDRARNIESSLVTFEFELSIFYW